MYNFTNIVPTTKKNPGVNFCQFIVIHHTGGWSYASNLHLLSGDAGKVSVHFVVWENGECAKIGDPSDILWHAWTSRRGKKINMNKYAMWIEVVGPNKQGGFSKLQFEKVCDLVKYLQTNFKIPRENVLCHHDITWAGSKDQRLWDWMSMCRKPDISRRFRYDQWFQNFEEFRNVRLEK
jgi:N-acetyl-anhydromuramyl-L-alanine amidase AmpD